MALDIKSSLVELRGRARIEVPGSLLNVGAYYVVVGVAGQQPIVSYERIQVCAFTIVDNGNYAIPEGSLRSGVIKPKLAWRTSKG